MRLERPPRIDVTRRGAGWPAPLRACNDQRQREPVVSLLSHRLYRCGCDARLGCDEIEQGAHALNAWIVAFRIDHSALAYDIVHYDQAPATRQLDRPGEIVRI